MIFFLFGYDIADIFKEIIYLVIYVCNKVGSGIKNKIGEEKKEFFSKEGCWGATFSTCEQTFFNQAILPT
jgi:hypothetical protein